MAPELSVVQIISGAGSRKELGTVVLENNLHQLVKPNHGHGFAEGMDRAAKTRVGRVANPQDIGRDGLIILNDINHLLGRRLGVFHQLQNSLDHRREGGQLNGRVHNAIYKVHSSLSPSPEVLTQTLPEPISKRIVRFTLPPISSAWMRTLFVQKIFRNAR